jgi:hypothetical protein
MPAYFQYAEEKLRAEVATMRYINDNTTIPMPFVLHYGTREESTGEVGPFIIMEWIENAGDVNDAVNTPGLTLEDPPILDPNVDEGKLERVYLQVSDILLQLSRCRFPPIGSLGLPDDDDEKDPEVRTRPLSLNVAQLANRETGHFWETFAARRTWAFDAIYWKLLDEKFFWKE